MNNKNYINIPDFMLKDEIQKLYVELLIDYITDKISDDDFINFVYELCRVEIFKDESIDIKLRNIIDVIMLKNCNYDNIRYKKNMLLCIVINLQLKNSFDKIKSSVDYWIDKDMAFYNELKYSIKIAEYDFLNILKSPYLHRRM